MSGLPEAYYDEGGITIYHGDCRDVLPHLPEADLILTDPPYALGGSRKEWRATSSVSAGIGLSAQKVKIKGAMLCFSTTSGKGIEFTLGAVCGALPLNRVLFWGKDFVNSAVAGPFRWDAVAILGFGRCTFGRPSRSSYLVTKAQRATDSDDTGHPAQLPESVGEWLYAPFYDENPDLLVIDPFVGSGTLLLPAAARGARAIGIDCDEKHCERVATRLRQGVLFGCS